MSVQVPSGLLNVKGANDPIEVGQANIELLTRSQAFMRIPSQRDGVPTDKYGTPWDSGIWPEGTLWVDVGLAVWRCHTFPGDTANKWTQVEYCISTGSFPTPAPDNYLVMRPDLDFRIFRRDNVGSTWVELFLSIKGAVWNGTSFDGSMLGPTILWRDPVEDMEAVTKRWVLDIMNPFSVSSFSAQGLDGTYKTSFMIGKTVTDVKFDWVYNRIAVDSQSINNGVGVIAPATLRTYTKTGLSITANTTWTLTGTLSSVNATRNASIAFYSPTYVGVNASTTLNSALLNGLPFWLQSNPYLTTGVTPGSKYIWIAYPASWTTAEIWVNGLKVTDWVTTNPFSHTNSAGYTQNYKVFRSANLLNGTDPLSVQLKAPA